MNNFMEFCIIASAFTGYATFVLVYIMFDKLREIEREISMLKKQKGGE